jgi:phosphotransferase system enzyme I (PtsI)
MYAGTMIAPGIAFGPALVWSPAAEPVQRRKVPAAAAAAEMQRFEHALRRAHRELEEIALRVAVVGGKPAAAIFTAHALLLEDPNLRATIQRLIEEEHWSAESAVDAATQEHAQRVASFGNSYLAARAEDLIELGHRLLTHLCKEGTRQVPALPGPPVLVAENLAAADVVALDRRNLLGLVMMTSGVTSHAALLAATLRVPVVGGVPQLLGQVRSGDVVIVDGNHGHVLVNPTDLALREYRTRHDIFDHFRGELAGLRDVPAVTPDGRAVCLRANLGLAEEIPHALAQGAEGIGLLRTEYFYLAHSQPPIEEEQYHFYAFGDNRLTPLPREPLWHKFLDKLDEPIIKVLLVAALLSMFVERTAPSTNGRLGRCGKRPGELCGPSRSATRCSRRRSLKSARACAPVEHLHHGRVLRRRDDGPAPGHEDLALIRRNRAAVAGV